MSEITERGAMAARWGGCAPPTKSWLMPGNEMPTIPTLPPFTQLCAATVSMMSPEHPDPRMLTPTVAKPSALEINVDGCGLSGSAAAYPEYSTTVGNGPWSSDLP